MAVYLTAAHHLAAQKCEKRTALFLDQKIALPYFNAFGSELVPLSQLYALLDQHIEQTLAKAGWSMAELKQIPIFLGSTAYVIADCEYCFIHQQQQPRQHSLTAISQYLQQRYQTQVFNFVTSCTSSGQAMRAAVQAMENGFYEKAIVIGFELFNRLTFEHFNAMNLLAQKGDYLPLLQSNGIILGEGMACLALSKQAHFNFECEIMAMHSITDHHNLTNSSATALQQLIDGILTKANLEPEQINAIKTHGVGSNSDEIELAMLQQTFPHTPLMILKSYLGHSLGASSALESAFLLQALQAGKLPDLPFTNKQHNLPLAHSQPLKCGYYLNYFLGFGGANVGWILKWKQ